MRFSNDLSINRVADMLGNYYNTFKMNLNTTTKYFNKSNFIYFE